MKRVMEEQIDYNEAVKELEEILNTLENSQEFNMDLITEKIDRAAVLIKVCKSQLKELDEKMENLLSQLD